jgi:hypothetical protein
MGIHAPILPPPTVMNDKNNRRGCQLEQKIAEGGLKSLWEL